MGRPLLCALLLYKHGSAAWFSAFNCPTVPASLESNHGRSLWCEMRVTLSCRSDQVAIQFEAQRVAAYESPVAELQGASLVFDDLGTLSELRVRGIESLCPYELKKVIQGNMNREIQVDLHSTYDSSCDMGYIYLDRRGPASVAYTVVSDEGVCIDIGTDGVILGLEIFSPSKFLPALAAV